MSVNRLFSRSMIKTALTVSLSVAVAILIFARGTIAQQFPPNSPPEPFPRSAYRHTSSDWVSIDSNRSETLTLSCPSGQTVVGGGFQTQRISNNIHEGFKLTHSYPEDSQTWQIRLRNTDEATRNAKIHIICAS